jgi:hypothetical protein
MPSKPRFDTSVARRLAARRVDESSLRAVAAEIGLSKSGLDHFLKGREPYAKTRVKLAAWLMRQAHPTAESIRAGDVDAAIALLDRYMNAVGSDGAREQRVREVADRLFRESPDTPPRKLRR